MFFNQQQPVYYGQQMQPNTGYTPARVPKNTQPLTPQRIAELRNKGTAFSLQVSQEDLDRAICTHRDPTNGQPTLIQNGDESVTCSICSHTFSPIQSGPAEIEAATTLMLDVLQTIKMLYLDIPEKTCAEFFQLIPLISKVPQLFRIAAENLKSYENTNPGYTSGGMNAFNMLQMLTSPGMMQQMPNVGYPQQYPQYQQQPVMQQQYSVPGYPMAPNPFGYNMPMQQPVQQQAPAQQMPTQQNTAQGATQQGTTDVSTTKVFHV